MEGVVRGFVGFPFALDSFWEMSSWVLCLFLFPLSLSVFEHGDL